MKNIILTILVFLLTLTTYSQQKIVRRLSDGLVQYTTTEPYELTDKYYKSDGIKAIDINSKTHEVIEDIVLPLDLYRGVHAYNDGVWTVLNQSQYDKRTEDLRTKKLSELKKLAYDKFYKNRWYYEREERQKKSKSRGKANKTVVEVPQSILDEDDATEALEKEKEADLLAITNYVELLNYNINLNN